MPECDECGAHVTVDYHRVFATREGRLRGCPACGPRAGAATGGPR